MTPAEYKQIREQLGLTQFQLAEKLGLCVQTIRAREQGSIKIKSEQEFAIKYLLQQPNPTPA